MQDDVFEFHSYGHPTPKGSKRHIGNGVLIEQTNVRPWLARVAADAAMMAHRTGHETFTGPVHVSCVFSFARPASHYGTGRNAAVLKKSAPVVPYTRRQGDGDKLDRAVWDALTQARVFRDDSQVAAWSGRKVWVERGAREGVVVRVRQMG